MKQRAVANRYARALVDALKSGEEVERAQRELGSFVDLYRDNAVLRRALDSPVIDSEKKRSVVTAIADKLELDARVGRFLGLVAEHDRITQIETIAEVFSELADARAGVVRAIVTSAAPLDESSQDACRRALGKLTGKTVKLQVETDPSIIGGLVVRIGSVVYDGSLEHQLARLGKQLSFQSAAAAQ